MLYVYLTLNLNKKNEEVISLLIINSKFELTAAILSPYPEHVSNHAFDSVALALVHTYKTPPPNPILPLHSSQISGGVSKSMLKKSRLNFDKIEKCK